MYDGPKIIAGLIVLFALITFPVWYNLATGGAGYRPELEKAAKGGQCVRDTVYMKSNHMDLLDEWRDKVVREGDRFEEGPDGVIYERSLTNTCLDCHENKDRFCDRCHNYLGVKPYCWSCHVDPKELQS